MRLLLTRLQLSEVADRLALSVNTVTTHVKSYRKLDADCRRTALARAYSIGLLERAFPD